MKNLSREPRKSKYILINFDTISTALKGDLLNFLEDWAKDNGWENAKAVRTSRGSIDIVANKPEN